MEREELAKFLEDVPILQFLPADVRELVIGSFVPAQYTFGQEIVKEGEPADALFLLISGKARAVKRSETGDELSLGTLGPGDTFGEGDFLNP
ncbi:MAG: cyclic nucleotide-binding domain-containing protein, partial [Gemmatimonadota bacterium]|nr:cyclic nucleotide-binding domain-containing protein [Gemmatimonadota bacterium]